MSAVSAAPRPAYDSPWLIARRRTAESVACESGVMERPVGGLSGAVATLARSCTRGGAVPDSSRSAYSRAGLWGGERIRNLPRPGVDAAGGARTLESGFRRREVAATRRRTMGTTIRTRLHGRNSAPSDPALSERDVESALGRLAA